MVAIGEATSFLLLIVASVVKRTGGTEVGVEILGPIHGALFVVYVALALMVRAAESWTFVQTLGVLFGAVVPLGGYVVDRWLARSAFISRKAAKAS